MCSKRKLKMEKYNTSNFRLCYACLSSDRRLSPLGPYAEIFHKIYENTYSHLLSEISLCWECRAELKKIQMFKDKIEKAQKALRLYYTNKEDVPLKCLSRLATATLASSDIQTITEELQEIKPLVDIKQELDVYISDDYIPESYLEDERLKEEQLKIETEDKTLIKKIKRIKTEHNIEETTRKLKYRRITLSEFKRVVVKVHISVSELDSWLERERNSEFFRNLTNKCEKCLSQLRHGEDIKEHNKLYHDRCMGPYSCDICQSYLTSKHQLSIHVARHYLAWRCVVCGYQCYSRAHMRTHLMCHCDSIQCIECGACFSNTRHFFGHYRALHREYICDHCNKRHRSKRVLERHMSHHLPSYTCKICNQMFKSIVTFRQHNLYKHAVDRPELAFCVQCNRQFDNAMQFRRHVSSSAAHAAERSSAGENKKKIPCPKCSNVYARKTNMMNHYRYVHMKESKYYCADCDKHFLNRTRYSEHRRYNHEGYVKEKDKLCNICGRGFAATRTLVNHIRTHTGERPFICTYCDSKFTQKHAMLSHVKFIHLKGKRKIPN